MEQEGQTHERNDDQFFDQGLGQVGDGAINQIGAIVDRHHLNALW